MNSDNKNIDKLFKRYISNMSSADDIHDLLTMIKSKEHSDCFDEALLSHWSRILDKEQNIDDVQEILLRKEALNILHQKNIRPIEVAPPRKKVSLWWKWTLAIASALLIFIIGAKLLAMSMAVDNFAQYVSGVGATQDIVLPDNSNLTINANTFIEVEADFNDNNRIVHLVGECYFDIAPIKEKAFIIKNKNIEVKVVGTSFNVKSYEEDRFVEITVTSGKVALEVANEGVQLFLHPNERFVLDKTTGSFEKKIVDSNKYTQWRQGLLYFERTPLTEVVKTLNRIYQEQITLKDVTSDFYITGIHDNKDIESVLKSIEYTTNLKYKKVNNEYIIF